MIRPRLRKKGRPRIRHLFLDSGAFSLYHEQERKGNFSYDWFDSKDFKKYLDAYAAFVHKYSHAIDYYVNMDAIHDPIRSRKALKYLEKEHGLSPVPVVHSGADIKYLDWHLERGYEFIGFGGMGRMKPGEYKRWLDTMFRHICPKSNDYRPIVRTHGFAVTSWTMLTRYPWWSVDSTTYNKMAGYGWLLIPHWKNGKWDFSKSYHQIGVCGEATPKSIRKYEKYYKRRLMNKVKDEHRPVFVSPAIQNGKKHIGPRDNPNREELKTVQRWCDFIGIPLGDEDTPGVSNTFNLRSHSNILYFDMLRQAVSKFPAQFKHGRGPTLFEIAQQENLKPDKHHDEEEVKLFFSGVGASGHRAEDLLEDACVMLTFYDLIKGPDKRFRRHLKERKKCKR